MSNRKAYTFIELMVTVTILSIGIVGIYRVFLTSLDYQGELTHRLYAINVLEHEIAMLENQYRAEGNLPEDANGKIIEAILENHAIQYTLFMTPGVMPGVDGLMPVEVSLSWPDRGHHVVLKRIIYLFNLNIKPTADASLPPQA